jgi:hypothetical protein
LEDLPIGGGNVMYLTQTGAGVVSPGPPSHNWLPSATGTMSNFSVAGTRSGSNEFTLDGIPNMTGRDVSFAPPADMVQEFRVQVVNYDAGLGRASGGHINMSLKAGTNQLHGTAQWEVAPNPWQANDFFTNKQIYDLSSGPVTDEKIKRLAPPRKVNRYSATVGGPLYLPRMYDGRNRTFWTYGFQGFNRRNPNNEYATVPTLAQRGGDFSALLALGPQFQIYDPQTIRPEANGRFSRQPLPGNIIPASRLDPKAQELLAYFAAPNLPGTADGRNNYQVTAANSNDFLQHMARIDHSFSDRHRVYGRYTYSWLNFYRGNLFNNEARGLDRYRVQNGAALDDVYMVSASFLLNFRYGFTLYQETDGPFSAGFDLGRLGFPPAFVSQLDRQAVSFPQIVIDQYENLGEGTNNKSTTNYHTWSATATQLKGSHSLRWGGEFRLMRDHGYSFGNATPRIEFGTNWTRGPLDTSPAAPIGQALASYLLGIPTGGWVDVNASSATQSKFGGLFIQDDWKVTRRLTFNLGLRWEYETAPTERFDRAVAGYDFTTPNPIQAAAQANYARSPIPQVPPQQFSTIGGLTFAGQGGAARHLFNTSRNNFAPRVGFAFQATPKMVIRSGYGIFFDVVGVDRIGVNQAGFSQRTTLVPSLDNGQTFIAGLGNPFPDGLIMPSSVGPTTFLGRGVSFQPDFRPTPYVQRWSISVQREFPGRTLLDLSYVGSRGTRFAANRQYNAVPRQYVSTSPERDQPVIDFLGAAVRNPFQGIPEFAGSGLVGVNTSRSQLLRPYPHFTSITGPEPVGYSWYHSLQVRVDKRFGRGFTVSGNYTFSKAMDAFEFLNDTDPLPHEAISPQDRAHRLAVSGIYELPFGKGRAFGANMSRVLDSIAGGWQVQGIYQAQSGQALGFGNILFRGDIHDIVLPRGERTVERWFNTDAGFERVNARQLGSNIRTFPLRLTGLRGPGDNYWDLSMAKNFQVTEKVKVQLRTNWEGATNTPLFANPNVAPANSLFGTINGTRGEARRIYVGLRTTF